MRKFSTYKGLFMGSHPEITAATRSACSRAAFVPPNNYCDTPHNNADFTNAQPHGKVNNNTATSPHNSNNDDAISRLNGENVTSHARHNSSNVNPVSPIGNQSNISITPPDGLSTNSATPPPSDNSVASISKKATRYLSTLALHDNIVKEIKEKNY